MQRKHTRHDCWQPKAVRPVSETGQAAFVELSLTQAGETGQTDLANRSKPVSRFCPETPQKPFLPQEPLLLWTRIAIAQLDFLAQKLFTTTHRTKPIRSVLVWTVGNYSTHRKNSNLPPIDLPICSTDQSETLGIVGVPHGLPLARSSVPKTHSIKRNWKSTLKNTSNPKLRKHKNRAP
jgi:hypothetical protein